MRTSGFNELRELLNQLPKEINHKVVGSALFQSAKPLVDKAKQNIRSKTGNLEKSIGVQRTTYAKAKQLGNVKVGPRITGGYKGYHGYNVEQGHRVVLGGSLPSSQSKNGRLYKAKNPARTGKGRVVGVAQPTPFLETAFKETIGEVNASIAKNLDSALRSAMKRHIKKSGTSFSRTVSI